ncbi:hypothetical protein PG990_008396 [Apiospora arundinis]
MMAETLQRSHGLNPFWKEEVGSVRDERRSLEDIYRSVAEHELHDVRHNGRRFAMMSLAGNESKGKGPTDKSVAFSVLREDNQAAIDRGKAAHEAVAAGRKRKASCLQDDIDDYKQNLDHIDTSHMHIDLTCDQVRANINKVTDTGIFKKTEFCDAIGCSNASVNAFLKKHGAEGGSTSHVLVKAWDYFKQREIAGLKIPDANKRRRSEAAAATGAAGAGVVGTAAGTSASAGAATGASASAPGGFNGSTASSSIPDISDIHLQGEDTDEVPIFETCDVVRRKISEHLRTHGTSQAQFCRDIYAQLKSPTKIKGIQSKQLADFRAKHGSNAGATSTVFYAAYVYFEKLRLAQGKPKSAHREEMEKRWPEGFDRKHDDKTPLFLHFSESAYWDDFGELQITGRR